MRKDNKMTSIRLRLNYSVYLWNYILEEAQQEKITPQEVIYNALCQYFDWSEEYQEAINSCYSEDEKKEQFKGFLKYRKILMINSSCENFNAELLQKILENNPKNTENVSESQLKSSN